MKFHANMLGLKGYGLGDTGLELARARCSLATRMFTDPQGPDASPSDPRKVASSTVLAPGDLIRCTDCTRDEHCCQHEAVMTSFRPLPASDVVLRCPMCPGNSLCCKAQPRPSKRQEYLNQMAWYAREAE